MYLSGCTYQGCCRFATPEVPNSTTGHIASKTPRTASKAINPIHRLYVEGGEGRKKWHQKEVALQKIPNFPWSWRKSVFE